MSNIHLTRGDIIYSDVTPVGNETPEYIGQICITSDDKVFFANGLANTNWIEASGDVDLSNLVAKEELEPINTEIENLKLSVSKGKTLVASAITDMGVSTSNNAEFQTMATNIRKLQPYNNPPVISELVIENIEVNRATLKFKVSDVENNQINSYKLKIGVGDYTTIVPNISNGYHYYTINNLNSNTAYSGFLKVGDLYSESSPKEFSFTTSAIKVYGIRIDNTNSNPNTSITYIEDASGVSPATSTGYGGWKNIYPFNQIKPCGFRNGSVTKYINPNDFTKYVDGTTVDYNDDVMIEFPKIYWNIKNIGNTTEIRISDRRIGTDYGCYAHLKGSVEMDKIYIGDYQSSLNANKLRSVKGGTIIRSESLTSCRTFAKNNGSGYEQFNYTSYMMVQILYLIMYKSFDSQTALGYGYCNGSGYKVSGETSHKGMIFGESTGTMSMKFLGIEDLWGNAHTHVDGIFLNNNGVVYVSDNSDLNFNSNSYKMISGITISSRLSGYPISMKYDNKISFFPISTGGSSSTYCCDNVNIRADSLYKVGMYQGGTFASYLGGGVFRTNMYYIDNSGQADISARLVYLG